MGDWIGGAGLGELGGGIEGVSLEPRAPRAPQGARSVVPGACTAQRGRWGGQNPIHNNDPGGGITKEPQPPRLGLWVEKSRGDQGRPSSRRLYSLATRPEWLCWARTTPARPRPPRGCTSPCGGEIMRSIRGTGPGPRQLPVACGSQAEGSGLHSLCPPRPERTWARPRPAPSSLPLPGAHPSHRSAWLWA